MSRSPKMRKRSLFSTAVAGQVLFMLAAGCNPLTAPSRNPPEPFRNPPEPTRNPPEPSRIDLSGAYTLTLLASSRCRLELPEGLRTRTYTATIVQAGGSLTVTLQYPSLWSWGQPNLFMGWFDGTHEVIFQFGAEEWWLDGGVEFHAHGRMTGTIVEEGLSGFLDGVVEAIVSNEGGRGNRTVTCNAPDHGVMFSR